MTTPVIQSPLFASRRTDHDHGTNHSPRYLHPFNRSMVLELTMEYLNLAAEQAKGLAYLAIILAGMYALAIGLELVFGG